MRNLIMRYTQVARFLGLIGLCFLIVSCASQKAKIDQVFDSLPVPPGAELIYEQEGTRQGSQDACFFTYKQYLYGTGEDFQQVAEFYRQILDAEPWRRDISALVPAGSLSWERNHREFSVIVRANPHLDFPKQAVASAEEKYKTVYFLSITYADRWARNRCLKRE